MYWEPKKVSSRHSKGIFHGVHVQFVLPAPFKNLFKYLEVSYPGLWFYHNIIHIVFHFLMYHIMEDSCHGSLVCGPCIFKAKRHHNVIKVSDWSPQCCLLYIFGSYTNLVVPIIPIHKWKYRTSCSWIHKEVNIRLGELIFWIRLIQIAKVHIAPNLVILFLYGYYVGKPLGVLDGLDKTSC